MRTSRWLWISALLLLLPIGIFSAAIATAASSDDAAIRRVMQEQQIAWNHGSIDGFMQGYEDSAATTFVGSSVRKGYRAILASYHKHYATKQQMGTLTFSQIDIRLLPGSNGNVQYAAVTGRFHLDRNTHGEVSKDDGVFSLLWAKTPAGWKIILDYTS